MPSQISPDSVRGALLSRREIALLDLREEDPHAQDHPLFAANLPLSRLEMDIHAYLPRRDVLIAVMDSGEGLAARGAARLEDLGYSNVAVLAGGLQGWKDAGYETFRDVNVPSKAFGELVEAKRHTPSLPAPKVKELLDGGADIIVLDSRPFGEYTTMSIPTGINVPGGELVYRVNDLVASPDTTVIVNCAGRTRSLIGTQSLVNAGIRNPVYALRNGTIGWTLAGLKLDTGRTRTFRPSRPGKAAEAAEAAAGLAARAGVKAIGDAQLEALRADRARTTYCFDVRTAEEYQSGHLAGFKFAPGGQLVQETEMFAAVRGARIVLSDGPAGGANLRANMTASWLAQMNWEVYVLASGRPEAFSETGAWRARSPAPPAVRDIAVDELRARRGSLCVVDIGPSAAYAKGHVPGAWFAIRSQFTEAAAKLPKAEGYVLASHSRELSCFAAPDLARATGADIAVLAGGTAAWAAAGHPLETGFAHMASAPIDRYRRPYEGTDNPAGAMQAYLDWEFGLVDQLGRDGTHGFFVV